MRAGGDPEPASARDSRSTLGGSTPGGCRSRTRNPRGPSGDLRTSASSWSLSGLGSPPGTPRSGHRASSVSHVVLRRVKLNDTGRLLPATYPPIVWTMFRCARGRLRCRCSPAAPSASARTSVRPRGPCAGSGSRLNQQVDDLDDARSRRRIAALWTSGLSTLRAPNRPWARARQPRQSVGSWQALRAHPRPGRATQRRA